MTQQRGYILFITFSILALCAALISAFMVSLFEESGDEYKRAFYLSLGLLSEYSVIPLNICWYIKNTNKKWWIGALFHNITPSNLFDVDNVALSLETDLDGKLYYLKQNPIKLDNFKEFSDFFGPNPNNYHPNEMTAKFSEWYYYEIMGLSGGMNYDKYPAFGIYKHYIDKLTKTFY